LPFLRITRDKRGYETTSLVHAVRRQGRTRYRILYWFRTPPGVKVGRPALDEAAIRWIEEHNPDIEFNWQKILETQPPATPSAEDHLRDRRDRRERRGPKAEPFAPTAEMPPATDLEAREGSDLEAPESQETPEVQEFAEAIEQLTHPDSEEKVEPPIAPVDEAVGREQLVRLRARYAELHARILERGGDPERIAALVAQAEPLNPDSWVTAADVKEGLERFESGIRDLRAALGLRRRRRSRRGSRRRAAEPGPTENPGNSSNGPAG
jgi:hypothetical protein